jgi:hypothetical protein
MTTELKSPAKIEQPSFELHPATTTLTTHEQIGFELGWDYAHHAVTPPAPYAQEPSALRNGWLAGQATFGRRTLEPTRHVRKWLQLRLNAWLRGRSVELVQVTPHYLQQIDVTHCPITRVALSSATMEGSDASIDRVRSDAGYAAGNLAVISTKANHGKAAHGFRDAQRFAKLIEDGQLGGIGGLNAAQWSRVATLCSFVEPLPHAEACTLPLLVLPPNRLRLFNPAQALQAFISQQLLVAGWSHRIARIEDLLPGKAARRAFQTFFHALLPRVLEARGAEGVAARWAIEDAWRNPLTLQRWTAFASLLTAEQCENVVARASARKLGTTHVQQVSNDAATDGWNLESRGYVPHAVLRQRSAQPSRQLSLLH